MGLLKVHRMSVQRERSIVIRKGRVKADRRHCKAVGGITSRARVGASGLNSELTRTRDLPPLPNPLRLSLAGCESERFVASVPSLVIRPSSGKSGEERRASQSIFGSGVELAIRQTGPRSVRPPLSAPLRSPFVAGDLFRRRRDGEKSQLGQREEEGDGPCNCPIRSGKVLPMQKEQMTPGSDDGIPLISATVLEDGDAMGCGLPSAFTKVNSSLLPPVTLPLARPASCLHRRRFVPRAYPLPLGGSGEGRGRSGPAPPCVRPPPCIICMLIVSFRSTNMRRKTERRLGCSGEERDGKHTFQFSIPFVFRLALNRVSDKTHGFLMKCGLHRLPSRPIPQRSPP